MRDLQKDLAICNKATSGPWSYNEINTGYIYIHCRNVSLLAKVNRYDNLSDAQFIAAAREGWPHAIERAIKAEAEVNEWQDVAEQRLESHLVVTQKVCRLEAENAKLRKVAEAAREFISSTGCISKECKKCDPNIGFCMWSGIGQALAELDKEGNKKD